jgi:hypothetical protein
MLSAYNARQFHHIYPKAHLSSKGIGFHEANVVANICMLTAADNNSISDAAPYDYLPKIDATYKDDVLSRALMPIDARDGTKPFKDFITGRAKSLAATASKLIQSG